MDIDPDDPIALAAADQLRAQAIEWLKKAKIFAILVPTEVDGEEGLAFMFSGPMALMLEMSQMLQQQLALQAAKQLIAELEEKGHSRDVLGEYLNINFEVKKGGEDDEASEERADGR